MESWKTVRIFISSTFRDMHSERDYLLRFVFPELRERCAQRKLHLVDVDLRWGVTEDEAEKGKALEVCLQEIDRCRPFFVGLIGQRYGYVPPTYEAPDEPEFHWLKGVDPGQSITALEIYHGVLRNRAMSSRSFFYFRDPEFLKDVPITHKSVFLPENTEVEARVAELKNQIRKKCLGLDGYSCAFNGIGPDGMAQLTGLEDFGRSVLEDLWAAISEEHPVTDRQEDPLLTERRYHEIFVESRSDKFVGRTELLQRLFNVCSIDPGVPILITGESGFGKSSLLAKFAKEYSLQNPGMYVLAHFIGVSPGSTSAVRTLGRVCRELVRNFEIKEYVPEQYAELLRTFHLLLQISSTISEVVILIDALDQLDDPRKALDWIPQTLPQHVRLVVSTYDQELQNALRRRKSPASEIHVGKLSNQDRQQIVRETLWRYRKRLDERAGNNQLELLLDKAESDQPLYLTVACEEMRLFGIFEKVSDRIRSLPDTVENLFIHVLERLEDDHTTEFVDLAVSLLALSGGLLESEMLELLGDKKKPLPPAIWARFYRSVQNYFRPFDESQEGELDFFHRQMKVAVEKRYLYNDSKREEVHSRLATYFQEKIDPQNDQTWSATYPRSMKRIAPHLLDAKRYEDLFHLAENDTFLNLQASLFSNEPGLHLETIRLAIEGAARNDDSARMAEFVLSHAKRLAGSSRQSPMQALQSNQFEGALQLADLYEPEFRALWYLLLVFHLTTAQKSFEAAAILRRLSEKEVPICSGWQSDYAYFLLKRICDLDREKVLSLIRRFLGPKDRVRLLIELREFENAAAEVPKFQYDSQRMEAWCAIAVAQRKLGLETSARESFARAEEEIAAMPHGQSSGYLYLCKAKAAAGIFDEALKHSEKAKSKVEALAAIAVEMWRHGKVSAAGEQMNRAFSQVYSYLADDLEQIIEAYAEMGNFEQAKKIIQDSKKTYDPYRRFSYAHFSVALAMARSGQFVSAIKIAKKGEPHVMDQVLVQIASNQAKRGDFSQAFKSLKRIRENAQKIEVQTEIARYIQRSQPERWEALIAEATRLALGLGQLERAEALLRLAETYLACSRPETACEILALALPHVPGKGDTFSRDSALEGFVQFYTENKQWQKAERVIDEIQDENYRGSAIGILCSGFIQSDKLKEAIKISRRTKENWVKPEIMADFYPHLDAVTAIKFAKQFFDGHKVQHALGFIAQAQASHGDFSGSLVTAEAMEPTERDLTRCKVASAEVKSGRIQNAIVALESTRNSQERWHALSDLAEAQSKLKDFSRAINSAAEISGHDMRGRTIASLIKAEVQAGEIALAEEHLLKLQYDPSAAAEAVAAIAETLAKSGKFSDAFQLIRMLTFSNSRAKVLGKIACHQAHLGDINGAVTTIGQIQEESWRCEQFAWLAAQCPAASSVAFSEALRLVKGIPDPAKEEAVLSIAEAQALRFGFHSAHAGIEQLLSVDITAKLNYRLSDIIKENISNGDLRLAEDQMTGLIERNQHNTSDSFWKDIGLLHVKVGNLQQARACLKRAAELALLRDSETSKSETIAELAITQIKLGLCSDINNVEQMILDKRDRLLLRIVQTLSVHNCLEQFKSFLLPSSFYLDSAFHAAGSLVRLYPEQADATLNALLRFGPKHEPPRRFSVGQKILKLWRAGFE